jgi:hypothetical protein
MWNFLLSIHICLMSLRSTGSAVLGDEGGFLLGLPQMNPGIFLNILPTFGETLPATDTRRHV